MYEDLSLKNKNASLNNQSIISRQYIPELIAVEERKGQTLAKNGDKEEDAEKSTHATGGATHDLNQKK